MPSVKDTRLVLLAYLMRRLQNLKTVCLQDMILKRSFLLRINFFLDLLKVCICIMFQILCNLFHSEPFHMDGPAIPWLPTGNLLISLCMQVLSAAEQPTNLMYGMLKIFSNHSW